MRFSNLQPYLKERKKKTEERKKKSKEKKLTHLKSSQILVKNTASFGRYTSSSTCDLIPPSLQLSRCAAYNINFWKMDAPCPSSFIDDNLRGSCLNALAIRWLAGSPKGIHKNLSIAIALSKGWLYKLRTYSAEHKLRDREKIGIVWSFYYHVYQIIHRDRGIEVLNRLFNLEFSYCSRHPIILLVHRYASLIHTTERICWKTHSNSLRYRIP